MTVTIKSELFTRGHASDIPKTRKLTEKIEQLISELATTLQQEDVTREQRAEAAAYAAEAAAYAAEELAKLDARRAELKAAIKAAEGTPARGGRTAEIRSWARGQGLPVSSRGLLSAGLIAEYNAAHAA